MGGDPAGTPTPTDFADLFDAHAPALLRYLTRRIGPAAPDLLSETFVAAITGRHKFNSELGDTRAWLYGIATNLLRRQLRQETRALLATARAGAAGLIDSDTHEADRTADRIDAQKRVSRLAAGIAGLNPGDREVLLLTAWAELDSNEVAAALAIPVGTVRSRLHRVRRQLRSLEAAEAASHTNFEVDDDNS